MKRMYLLYCICTKLCGNNVPVPSSRTTSVFQLFLIYYSIVSQWHEETSCVPSLCLPDYILYKNIVSLVAFLRAIYNSHSRGLHDYLNTLCCLSTYYLTFISMYTVNIEKEIKRKHTVSSMCGSSEHVTVIESVYWHFHVANNYDNIINSVYFTTRFFSHYYQLLSEMTTSVIVIYREETNGRKTERKKECACVCVCVYVWVYHSRVSENESGNVWS